MNKTDHSLIATPVLFFLMASCATPPPVREVPHQVWSDAQDLQWIRERQYERKLLTRTIPGVLSPLEPLLSDVFRQEMLTSGYQLQEALQSGTPEAVDALFARLKAHKSLLEEHGLYSARVIELRAVVGNEAGSTVRDEIDRTLADGRRALGGTSWDDVQTTRDNLVELYEQKLNPAQYFIQLQADLRDVGEISPMLTAQMQASMEPLRRALDEGSWQDMRERQSLAPPVGYARRVRDRIEQGKTWIASLQPEEGREIATALAATRSALLGDSWERLMTLADGISESADKIGTAWEPAPCVRILSIDGGGIRGIIPATMLAEIERRTGKRIFELFDIIAGTSTGGILALGLTTPRNDAPDKARYTAQDLLEMYLSEGKDIFPARPLKGVRQMLLGPAYRADPLEKLLQGYFKDAMFVEALTNVVIPIYRLEVPGHILLTTYGDEALHIYMWEAARATSAAPTYFPPYRLPLGPEDAERLSLDAMGTIDGGVFANNPALQALATAKRWEHGQRGKPDDLRHPTLLLSLGTGSVDTKQTFEQAWSRGGLLWIPPLLKILTSDPGDEKQAFAFMRFGDPYLRMQPVIPESNAKMDDVRPDNMASLRAIADKYMNSDGKRAEFDRIIRLLQRERPPECKRIVDPVGKLAAAEALRAN